ncbi:MAG: methyltransferase domain-containing protein [Deltaproteobacteria bacterium]|nr:methyltransferase domain-containing protein [Deltaproteobacteria bacterium]
MKNTLLDMLICPSCLPGEHPLRENVLKSSRDDILEGGLHCATCGSEYRIQDGIAFLNPNHSEEALARNRYETAPVVSSYLWSHFGDLLGDEEAADAYRKWASLMRPCAGVCLDTGAAVGRFSFEMANHCDFVLGIDSSVSFIQTSRELMVRRSAKLELSLEGSLTQKETITLPPDWKTDNIEFIVADALALPFRSGLFSAVSSLNIVDKVAKPMVHISEINRSAKKNDAQFLFSDPFSWSTSAAREEDWLGGTAIGGFSGRGRDNVIDLLEGRKGSLSPPWKVDRDGYVWWKIRTHANHFELIRSCFVKAIR